MSDLGFNQFLEGNEDQILMEVLESKQLVDPKVLRSVYQKMQQSPSEQNCKLGQMLVRQRYLSTTDYVKANILVQQHAQILYQKELEKKEFGATAKRRVSTLSSQKSYTKKNSPQNISSPSSSPLVDKVPAKATPEGAPGKIGTQFGDYEILEEIARGGMGIVYKAKQRHLNRIVALKVLLAGGAATEQEVERFRREAESAGKLQHPNIVAIYQIGKVDCYHYFTMDFIAGDTLQALIKSKKRRKALVQILEKVARALDHAHQRGIVHRDIKPSNIIVTPEGEPKITDFGLAKNLEAQGLTEKGSTLGTPYYMAPEQTLGTTNVDGRADVYSMGVILYEILTHRLPFNASTIVELYHKIVEEEPIPPSKLNKQVEKPLEMICLKAMEKEPSQRYESAAALAEDLRRYLAGEAVSAKRASFQYRLYRKLKKNYQTILIGSGVFLFLVALILFWLLQVQEKADRKKRLAEVNTLLEQARGEVKAKNSIALSTLEKAIKKDPNYSITYRALGDAHRAFGEYMLAIKDYSMSLSLDDQDALAYFGRGKAYASLEKSEKLEQALQDFNLAIQYDPRYLEAYSERLLVLEAMGKEESEIKKAVNEYNQVKDEIEKEEAKIKEAQGKKNK